MNDKSTNYVANIGRFALLFVGINVLATAVLLLFHISVSALNIFLGLGTAIIVYFYISDCDWKKNWIVVGITCGCFVMIVIVASILNEIAYDANLYHKLAIGILKMGYNPIYENVEEYLIKLKIPEECWYDDQIWVGCYPKASWYFDSTIYAVTNWIESSKAFNLMVFIASFGICYNYFFYKLNKRFAYLITFLLTVTPTSMSMFLTLYLDGALGNLLITSIVILMSITDESYTESKGKQFVYLALCIILCGNLKITGLAFEGIFCFSFFFLWLLQLWKKEKKHQALCKIGKLIAYYVVIVSIAIFVVGAGTYISNFKNYGNPLYPLGEMEGFDISNNLKSVGLEKANPLIQMLSMIFVRTNTNDSLTYLEWKIPFTFELDEIKHSVYDVIRGGTGVFYSGILCISFVMFLVWSWKFRKDKDIDKIMSYMIIATSFILLCFVPAGGQTRYSPYIFYFVTFTIYLWMIKIQNGQFVAKFAKKIPYIMSILLLLNIIPFTNYSLRMVLETIDYKAKYDAIEAEGGVYMYTRLPGLVFNMIDRNIEYVYDTESELTDGEMKYLWLTYNYFEENSNDTHQEE